MKVKLFIILLTSVFILSSCSGKDIGINNPNKTLPSVSTQDSNSSEIKSGAACDLEATKHGTLDKNAITGETQLTAIAKEQLENEANSTLNDIDNSLKSLEDVDDIDLSSLNK